MIALRTEYSNSTHTQKETCANRLMTLFFTNRTKTCSLSSYRQIDPLTFTFYNDLGRIDSWRKTAKWKNTYAWYIETGSGESQPWSTQDLNVFPFLSTHHIIRRMISMHWFSITCKNCVENWTSKISECTSNHTWSKYWIWHFRSLSVYCKEAEKGNRSTLLTFSIISLSLSS